MKEAWFHQGRQLLRSAEALLEQLWECKRQAEPLLKETRNFDANDPDFEIVERSLMEPVISMLTAYALENFLKGLWVFQNPTKVKSALNLPQELTKDSGHDLNRLCILTGLKTTSGEQEVLRVLSDFARWRGRYAIERTAERNAEHCIISEALLRAVHSVVCTAVLEGANVRPNPAEVRELAAKFIREESKRQPPNPK